MPFRSLVLTSDTFNTWLAATNETIDYVSNTQVFLQAQASATPSESTGNVALAGVMTVSALRANTNAIFSGANVYINASSVTVVSAATHSGAATFTNTLTAQGPVAVQGASLAVNAAAVTFSGSGTVTSNVATTVANTFTVVGAANLASTLTVTGTVNALGTFGAVGTATLANTLAVTGAVTASNTLNVIGATTLSALTVSSTVGMAGNLTVSANVTIGNSTATTGYLTVRQTSSFQNTVSTLGLLTANAGLAVAGGTLTVGTSFTVNSTGFVTDGNWRGAAIPLTYTTAKVVTVNGQAADGSGNVTVSSGAISGVVELAGAQTITGRKSFTSNLASGGMGTSTASLGALEITSTGANAAFFGFHRTGSYAVYFGLDTDNVLKVGGWSAGTNAQPVLLANNFNAYAPTLTGVGASGSWNISITGNAAFATTAATATSASSATSATNATQAATQANTANDTTIATTAFVKNVLNGGSTYTHNINGSATSVPASGVTVGTFPSGQFVFTTGLTVSAGSPSAPSLKVTNASGTQGGMYAGSNAVEFGARFDVSSSQSIVRAHHGTPLVDFIVGGAIPLTIQNGYVGVSGQLTVIGVSQLNGNVVGGANTYSMGLSDDRWNTVYAINPLNSVSDLRLKTVVSPSIPSALSLVSRVSPFLYYFTELGDTRVRPGFAAQQVRDVIDGALGTEIVEGSSLLSMSGDYMVPILWAAVNELASELTALRASLGVSTEPIVMSADSSIAAQVTGTPRSRKKR